MLRDGQARVEVIEVMRRRFGASTRAADSYIARARERWATESTDIREVQRTATLARLDRLFARAERRGAFAAAVSAEKLRAQICGLLAPRDIHVSLEQMDVSKMSDEQLELIARGLPHEVGSIGHRAAEVEVH